MTTRPFSNDKPQWESIHRRAAIRARIDGVNYLVDPGNGEPTMAYYGGPVTLVPGDQVIVAWANEGGILLIRGKASPENPTAPLSQQSGTQTPINGGGA